MSLELIAIELGILGLRWAYHRWGGSDDDGPAPQDEIQIPLTQEGAAYPLIYGRCRVRDPILAWAGDVTAVSVDDVSALDAATYYQGAPYLYYGEFLFNIGIGFQTYTGVQPANYIYGVYAGDQRISDGPYPLLAPNPGAQYVRLEDLTGVGSYESSYTTGPRPCFVWAHYDLGEEKGSEFEIGGLVEFYNGAKAQQLTNGAGVASTVAGERMLAINPSTPIPDYRGLLSIFLGGQTVRWSLGSSGRMHAMGFEAGSYPVANFGSPTIGLEANPVDVLYDILTGTRGKLSLPTSLIDTTSFQAAANALYAEGNGYSRSLPAGRVRDMIQELLVQMDGVLYPDYATQTFKLKLIRADYRMSDLTVINPDTAQSLEFVESYGWPGMPTKFRLIYSDRNKQYDDNSVTTSNEGNAVFQIEGAEEQQIRMPGVCTGTNARALVRREASARVRPLKKLKAIVNRSFWNEPPGNAVLVNWPEYSISNVVFRVARPSRRGADANTLEIDLIEDFFYTHRFEVFDTNGLPPSGAVE